MEQWGNIITVKNILSVSSKQQLKDLQFLVVQLSIFVIFRFSFFAFVFLQFLPLLIPREGITQGEWVKRSGTNTSSQAVLPWKTRFAHSPCSVVLLMHVHFTAFPVSGILSQEHMQLWSALFFLHNFIWFWGLPPPLQATLKSVTFQPSLAG